MTRNEFKNAVNALIDEAVPKDVTLEGDDLNSLSDAVGSELVEVIFQADDEQGDEAEEDEDDVADEQTT